MFDNIVIEFQDKEYELQTKRFECVLDNYHVGDVVEGAYLGSHTYIDELLLNEDKQIVYSEVDCMEKFHVLISLSETVFCEYEVIDWNDDESSLMVLIKEKQQKWKESRLLVSVMLDSLKRYAHKECTVLSKLQNIKYLIDYAKEGESGLPFTLRVSKDSQTNIDDGHILDEIKMVLEEGYRELTEVRQLKEIHEYYL